MRADVEKPKKILHSFYFFASTSHTLIYQTNHATSIPSCNQMVWYAKNNIF